MVSIFTRSNRCGCGGSDGACSPTACTNCEPGDISVQRNNNTPQEWQLLASVDPDVLFDLTGSELILTVTFLTPEPPAPIILSTDDDDGLSMDIPTATVTWDITLVQSTTIPVGRNAYYTLDRLISAERRTMVQGYVTGLGANG